MFFLLQNLSLFPCPGHSRAAVNRAVETVPGNSLIAVLSTSALLLPASAADASAPVPSMRTAAKEAGSTANGVGSQGSASDIFVAFEQARSSISARSSWTSPGEGKREPGAGDAAKRRQPGADGTRYDQYGHVRRPHDAGDASGGLLITVLPSHVAAVGERERVSHRSRGDRARPSGEGHGNGQGNHEGGAEEKERAHLEPGTLRGRGLSDAAPLPLLVFDSETFSALGELDERFAFQGGVAEWISRARLGGIDESGSISAGIRGACCSCDDSPGRCRRSTERTRPEVGPDAPPGPPRCSDGTTAVPHIHAHGWGRRFVGLWSDESVRPPEGSSVETGKPDARRPGVRWLNGDDDDDDRKREIGKRAFGAGEAAGGGEVAHPSNSGDRRADEGFMVDQWTRLPPARLEALVQADADLFFLPLLLSQHPSGENRTCLPLL